MLVESTAACWVELMAVRLANYLVVLMVARTAECLVASSVVWKVAQWVGKTAGPKAESSVA